jgi:hypothetical protein
MPHRRDDWQGRIKAVEREHRAMQIAADSLLVLVERKPNALNQTMRPDLRNAAEHLEGTYIIRLFAEFETAVRLFWHSFRNTNPPTETLINRVATHRNLPDDWRQNAHAVREYRNLLVHERDEDLAPIPIAHARGHLCRFVSFLPQSW